MRTTNNILLVQPRHIYAPDFDEYEEGHIYLPSSLITIAAYLDDFGIEVSLLDENIEEIKNLPNVLGINLLGAPYIPVVKRFEALLYSKYGNDYVLFIGGQIVDGLTDFDFKQLFSSNVINGNDIKKLIGFFKPDNKSELKAIQNISHIPIYKKLTDNYMRRYLGKEIGFYLSQGCKFSCTFCSATRTKKIGNVKIMASEQYRNIEIALKDLEFLILKSKEYGFVKLEIYLSNLDLFQTPAKLNEFAEGVRLLIQKHDFLLLFRALSTVDSFLKAHLNFPLVINSIKEIGLNQVGFGIDGATPEVYKATKKPQNVQNCLDAIRISKSVYGIIPETLMVFGHNGKEDEQSLKKALMFCKDMQYQYQSLPRPHIAKDIVPGNDGWNNPDNHHIREEFYRDITLFQNLDFTALPSPITHPDKTFREMVSRYYIEICEMEGSLTQYVYPLNGNLSHSQKESIIKFNKSRYDL